MKYLIKHAAMKLIRGIKRLVGIPLSMTDFDADFNGLRSPAAQKLDREAWEGFMKSNNPEKPRLCYCGCGMTSEQALKPGSHDFLDNALVRAFSRKE